MSIQQYHNGVWYGFFNTYKFEKGM